MTEITLLDGGMGQELIKRAGQATPLWSTQALLDNPSLVSDVHRDYADAGATMATTNTYALHRDRLRGGASNHYADDGVDLPNLEPQLADLLRIAAAEAVKLHDRSRIAGSIGPLGASYRSDLHPPLDEATDLYREVAQILAPSVDVLLFETIASLDAARACLAGGRMTDRPVWLAFTVDDEDGTVLRSGEPLADAVSVAAKADAALINCSAPEVISDGLAVLASAGVPLGAYGNAFTMITKAFLEGGTTAADLAAREDMTPDTYATYAMQWVDQGATIIGGCCETGPAHIAEIAKRLNAAGHTLV